MTPQHHLDSATILACAAGALTPAMSVVAATHLEVCASCRRELADAERIGGLLLEEQQPLADASGREQALRRNMLARLADETPPAAAPAPSLTDPPFDDESARDAPPANDPDRLPRVLWPHFGTSYRQLRWKWVAPGIHRIRAASDPSGQLFMLKIGPGKKLPMHSHQGSELTQILSGAYDDVLGHFAPGDMADLDCDVEHQPVTTPGVPCICVAALDAPLRFPGWLARKLQPWVGM